MRKIKSLGIIAVVAFMFLFGSAREGQAQSRSNISSAISADPISLLVWHVLNAQYEWKASTFNSYVVRGDLYTYGDFKAFGAGFAYRWYLADTRAITGLSLAPSADILFFSNGITDRSSTAFTIGGDLAYKWNFNQFVVEPILRLFIGIAGNDVPSGYSGVNPTIGVNLGYGW